MNEPIEQELNRRCVRALRGLMSAWARRWRAIRREHESGTRGREFIKKAVELRELAKRWQKL